MAHARVPSLVAAAVAALATLFPVAAPQAAETAHEGFRPSFPAYASGGSGFTGPWAPGGFNAFSAAYASDRHALCLAGARSSPWVVLGEAFPQINGVLRRLQTPLGADGTTAYLSFLIEPRGTLGEGIYDGFFGITLNGSLGADFFVGKPGGGATGEWVVEGRGGTGQVSSGVPAVVGRTALLVVRVDFLPGNDVFTLYVNPAPGRPEPSSGARKADIDLGTVSAIGIYSTGAFALTDIRVGTAFADVMPPRGRGDERECRD